MLTDLAGFSRADEHLWPHPDAGKPLHPRISMDLVLNPTPCLWASGVEVFSATRASTTKSSILEYIEDKLYKILCAINSPINHPFISVVFTLACSFFIHIVFNNDASLSPNLTFLGVLPTGEAVAESDSRGALKPQQPVPRRAVSMDLHVDARQLQRLQSKF